MPAQPPASHAAQLAGAFYIITMATFTSKPITVNASADAVAQKFSDFSRLQEVLDNIPAEQRAKIGELHLTADSIVMNTPQVGEITLKVIERTPSRMVLEAMGSPVPMHLAVDVAPAGDASHVTTSMDVDIPAFMKPMLGGTLQKAVDQFAVLIGNLA